MDKQKKPTNYETFTIELLEDPLIAASFLNEVVRDFNDDDEISQQTLLSGLRKTIEAQIGFQELAKSTGLDQENLEMVVSGTDRSQLGILLQILQALGFEINISVADKNSPN